MIKKALFKVFNFSLVLLALTSCNTSFLLNKSLYAFNTFIDLNLYEGNDNHIDDISGIIKKYDMLCDPYNEFKNVNNIYTINHSDEPVVVTKELFNVLKEVDELTKISKGYFNPLMLNLNTLWKDNLKNLTIPSNILINKYLQEIKNTKLILDESESTVQLIGDAKIDLGGVCKGYVLDEILSYLKENKIQKYLINCGTSSIGLGNKDDGKDFIVGFEDIKNAYYETQNEIITVSSIFRQGVEIDNKKFSHIINPFDGSAQTKYDMVFIASKTDAALADVLTTAFSYMELKDIKELEKEYELKVLLYNDDKIIYQSEGLVVDYN